MNFCANAIVIVIDRELDSRWWEPATEVGIRQDSQVELANNSLSTAAI
jgi:hypothetical protein